jgi:hypothetical protein
MDIEASVQIGVVIVAVIAGILAIIGAFYGVLSFIDKRIENRIRDDGFIHKLASALRPTVIFNQKGSILVDQGAMQFIKSIDIKLDDDKNNIYPKQIIIHATKHLSYAPLLSPLDGNGLSNISISRGKKYDWIYILDYFMTNDEWDELRYRLEIIL